MNYPVKKLINISGVKVEICKFSQDRPVGAKVYCENDACGISIYKYLLREGFISENFLFSSK
jgi:hypothetical protein